MANLRQRSKLSNLELTVLGLVWMGGPCTIYAVMKDLSMSASSFHKSRAGATYSVCTRLLRFGLIQSTNNLVQITDLGLRALGDWYTTPVPMVDVAHSADLIRLRFFFLGTIPMAKRLEFIDSSIEGLLVYEKTCEALLQGNQEVGDYHGVLASAGVLMETRARIHWLSLVRSLVENPIEDETKWASTVKELLTSHRL